MATRRKFIAASAGVTAGLFAGCGGLGGKNEDTQGSYSVEMAPVGKVTFDTVPKTWIAYDGGFADMAVALGQADGITGIGYNDRYYTDVYEELDGVTVDEGTLKNNDLLNGNSTIPKEALLGLQNDVHLMDPKMLINWFGWKQEDIDQVENNAGPFFGNLIFRREDEWHDYRYYTLYEAFRKVAKVFKAEDRYRQFETYHDEFITKIQTEMPSADQRPNVLLVYAASDEPTQFSPYRLNDKGTSKKQWHDLGVSDALAGTGIKGLSTTNRGKIDYETMLEVDPDVIMVRGHERQSAAEFRDTVLSFMENHEVASQLTAVENGRVYRGGYLHQGPIHNFFLTERAAKQLYPDVFGAVTSDEQLFDRSRIANIVTGED